MNLIDEFARIKAEHRKALKKRSARCVLGPSVMRVYRPRGTRKALLRLLPKIDIDELAGLTAQPQYDGWFDRHVDTIARVIARHNPGNRRIRPGLKWGHATKIMALFVRDVVMCSRYFPDAVAHRVSYFLHAPIDSIAIRRLKDLDVTLPFAKIKEIDTREKFYRAQDLLKEGADWSRVPRVWFDDGWAERE